MFYKKKLKIIFFFIINLINTQKLISSDNKNISLNNEKSISSDKQDKVLMKLLGALVVSLITPIITETIKKYMEERDLINNIKDKFIIPKNNYNFALLEHDSDLKKMHNIINNNFINHETTKGILVYGDPGNSKNYNINFITAYGKIYLATLNFQDLFSNKLAPSVKLLQYLKNDIFSKNSKYILLLDEIDLLCTNRKFFYTHQDKEDLSFLLTFIEELNKLPNVIVIGNTNKSLNDFDDALLRPGRLTTHMKFGNPSLKKIKFIIQDKFTKNNQSDNQNFFDSFALLCHQKKKSTAQILYFINNNFII